MENFCVNDVTLQRRKTVSKVFSQIGFEKAGGKIKCFLKPFQMFVELGPVDEGSSKLN